MPSLEERFSSFMNELTSIECIDRLDLVELNDAPKADYLGLDRNIVFEQKCITQDQTQKIQDHLDQFQNEAWYPLFFGERDINQILKYFPDPEEVKREVISRISKLIEDYFKKANKQISSTKEAFQIDSAIGVLVILNDSVPVLSPQLLAHRARDRLIQTGNNRSRRFDSIDLVIVISDTHLLRNSNPIIIQIDGPSELPETVLAYLQRFYTAWAHFNGGRVEFLEQDDFNWEDIKERFEIPTCPTKRHEARSLWYRDNPYLRKFTDQEVFEFGARVMELTAPFFIKGGPEAPKSVLGEMTLAFGDFIDEANFRGLDMKRLKGFIDRESIDRQINEHRD